MNKNPNLNQEQIEAHFMEFCSHWNRNVLPKINSDILDGAKVSQFDAGRMFENLWEQWLSKVELDYWEAIGLLDL